MLAVQMLAAIDFHNQAFFNAHEVKHIAFEECYPIPTPALPLKGREQPTLSVTPVLAKVIITR